MLEEKQLRDGGASPCVTMTFIACTGKLWRRAVHLALKMRGNDMFKALDGQIFS